MSHERIQRFIQDTVTQAKEQVRPEGKPQEIDFSRYIKDWVIKYGFIAQQAKTEIDKWVAEAEQKNDPYQLGLAAYAKKNFGEAGKLFEESATGKARRAQEASTTARQLTDEAIQDFRLAGDAHTSNYQFDLALLAYQKAKDLTSGVDQPRLWAELTALVGGAEYEIGIRTEGAKIHHHLRSAVAAYRAALTVYTKEQLPQDWAMTQNNLGLVLQNQGTRTGGEAGTQLLAQAVAAYRDALTVRTKEALPQDWAQTHNNLAKAALSLEDWPTAVESYRDVLMLYPDYNEAYQILNSVYHEKLFAYTSAFDLTKQWLARHPNDLSVQANFAEAHLTTGRYEEAERRIAELLKKPDLDPSSLVGLRVLEIANTLALKKAAVVPQKLQGLRTFVSGQPENFHVGWSFGGTKHYVQAEQAFARYRTWLMDLFSITDSKDRASLLPALDARAGDLCYANSKLAKPRNTIHILKEVRANCVLWLNRLSENPAC